CEAPIQGGGRVPGSCAQVGARGSSLATAVGNGVSGTGRTCQGRGEFASVFRRRGGAGGGRPARRRVGRQSGGVACAPSPRKALRQGGTLRSGGTCVPRRGRGGSDQRR